MVVDEGKLDCALNSDGSVNIFSIAKTALRM